MKLLPFRIAWFPGSLGLLVFLHGCAKEHRISFDQFLQMQRAGAQTEIAEPAELPPPVDVDDYLRPYTLGPGDVVTVTLTGMGEAVPIPAFQARVDRNGEIELPLAGRLKVAGLELEDVEKAIHGAFVPAVYNQVVVSVTPGELDTTKVLVVGAVGTPGLTALRRNERTMLHAIVAAGGVSDIASGTASLRRLRRPREITTFDIRDPIQLQQALAIEPLERGDIVEVHSARPNTVFVGGLVNRIGPQSYPSGSEVTVLQALASAGGPRTDVFPKEGTLVRRMSDGSDVHVKLDLGRLARGEDPNIALAAGDILWVPDTAGTRIMEFVNRNIFFRAGVSVTYNVSGIEYMNRNSQQNGMGGSDAEGAFDPLGFLQRNAALSTLTTRPPP